ncbi:MAG: TerB family tellurite resistance protein [Myxococcales bacterium]|nr:TerB family tellurite resistance protein [Myxococcales bacterium]
MLIFGTRGVTYRSQRGVFTCPTCGPGTEYAHKRVRRFFSLYFIPVVPLDLLGEYVECSGCSDTYRLDVLDFDPEQGRAEFEAEFHAAVRRVMIQMMVADGVIDDAEIVTIATVYQGLTERSLEEAAIREEAERLQRDPQSVEDFVSGVRGRLNDHGKELVIRAALAVASADGTFSEDERVLLMRIGDAMEMTRAHLMGVLHTEAQA